MTIQHDYFSDQSEYGRRLRRANSQFEDGLTELQRIKQTMDFMIDGDGSDAAQFGTVVTRFGFGSTADAKAAWDELGSFLGKLTTDAAVSSVSAAIQQYLNKLR